MGSALRDILVRADALVRQRKPREARALLAEFAQMDPSCESSAEYLALFAQACLHDGLAEQALERIDRALQIRRQWADAFHFKAVVQRRLHASDAAEQTLRDATKIFPSHSPSWILLA